ncbi:AAA family ATPase, partial [Acinetobacter baumannii]
LKLLFENDSTTLIFKEQSLKFKIKLNDREFDFQNLSSGYQAIFDIFADLLVRTEFFDISPEELRGIVLIDEIDAHLHISLQKKILPFFTNLFPSVQFIVSTHSPFVITSTDDDTVVYDISSGEFFEDDLSRYSYESVIKGLFHVETQSEQLASETKAIAEILNNEPNNYEKLREILRNISPFAKQLDVESKSFYFKALNHLLDNQELGDLDV